MKTVKRSVQCQVFEQSPPGRRSNDKYPVKPNSLQYRDVGGEREMKEIETALDATCQENLSACHMLASPDLDRFARRRAAQCSPLFESAVS